MDLDMFYPPNTNDEDIWKQWFKYWCRIKNDSGAPMEAGSTIVRILAHSREFSWAEHCPETVGDLSFPEFLIKHGKFEQEWGGRFTIPDHVAQNISYVFETLYKERPDFTYDIISLNGEELYAGRSGGFVGGTGDNEIGWNTDDSPSLYLNITAISEVSITVGVSQEQWVSS